MLFLLGWSDSATVWSIHGIVLALSDTVAHIVITKQERNRVISGKWTVLLSCWEISNTRSTDTFLGPHSEKYTENIRKGAQGMRQRIHWSNVDIGNNYM